MATSLIKSIRHTLDTGRALVPYREPDVVDAQIIRIDPGGLRTVDEAPAVMETRTPHRAPALEPDVYVPSLQTVATAIAAGLPAGLLAWVLGWPWQTPVAVLAVVFGLSWLWHIRAARETLWQTERMTAGSSTPAATPIAQRSYLVANPAQARQTAAQAVAADQAAQDRADLLAFVDRCLMCGCQEAAHGILAGGPARRIYLQRRDTLMRLGIATWKNEQRHGAGWRIAVSRQRARQLLERHIV